MAPATLYDRPRLDPAAAARHQPRGAARLSARAAALRWIDDPTNVDANYERARLRAMAPPRMPGDGDGGCAARRGSSSGADAAAARSGSCRLAAPGLVALDRAFRSRADRDAAIYALRILLAAAGGTEHLPDLARTPALFGRLGQAPFRATLSRAVVDARRDAIFVRRENRGMPGRRGRRGRRYLGRALPARRAAGRRVRSRRSASPMRRRSLMRDARRSRRRQPCRRACGAPRWPSSRRCGGDGECQGLARRGRHGAANHRALGALPAILRSRAGPRRGCAARRRHSARRRHCPATKSAKVNRSRGLRLGNRGRCPYVNRKPSH